MILTAYTTVIHTANSSKESFHGFHFCLHQNAKFLRRITQSTSSSAFKISGSVQQSAGRTVSISLENWTKPK